MRSHRQANLRSGVVLLVVLFVSMVVAILSTTVIVRANRQTFCAGGSSAKLKMDYLAEAGLVHAKTLLLHPQNVNTSPAGYWTGGDSLFIEAGDAYYDLKVTRSVSGFAPRCTYDIESHAYRLNGAERVVCSDLAAQLRLDPCIAYWAGAGSSLPACATIHGDVYCAGSLNSAAVINGDVFADSFTGLSAGQVRPRADVDLNFPGITPNLFSPVYSYSGLFYMPRTVAPADCNNPAGPFTPTGANPAGVLYRGGSLELVGAVTIYGTLVVNGDVTILKGITTIRSAKNFPAMVVNGRLTLQDNAQLDATGLVQVNTMTVAQTAGSISVLGALFIKDAGAAVDPLYGGSITVTCDPVASAIKLYSQTMVLLKWSPAADAFFKYVKRE